MLSPHLGRARGGTLERRLRQARAANGRQSADLVLDHCARVAGRGLAEGAAVGCALLALGGGASGALAGFALGAVAGAARQHAGLDRALDERRARMRIELYTVNQLLALDVRAGGGVAQALERIARRGEGAVAEEVRDVLATVRAGLPLPDALEAAAGMTAEPAAARTYRLLAKGARFGTDLATGLRALNEDLRAQRAEAIERAATKRRAAMLLPIIGLLAPVMLLFIAAPLPAIVFGTR
jgi:pilus assembly protein TadC